MIESLPPISRTVRLIQICPGLGRAARKLISSPASREPVNAMKRVFGCSTTPCPKVAPEPGQKLTTPLRAARVFQKLEAISPRSWESRSKASKIDSIAADDRGDSHSRHNRESGKYPRRDHRADAQRNVIAEQASRLPGSCDNGLSLLEMERCARVEVAEVEGLAGVGLGFIPVLAVTSNTRLRVEFELTFAQQVRNAERKIGVAPWRARSSMFRTLQAPPPSQAPRARRPLFDGCRPPRKDARD